jgi:23S rRNA (pseudouridine1915-N3)-methyltransferase
MIYKIACVGKIKEKYYTDLIEEYKNKISGKNRMEIFQVPDEKIPKKPSESVCEQIKEREGARLLNGISQNDYVVALCIDGKKMTTSEMAALCVKAEERGFDKIVLVIGGSLGLSEAVIQRADMKLSFSDMTFPHQLMRVMLADQIAAICDR